MASGPDGSSAGVSSDESKTWAPPAASCPFLSNRFSSVRLQHTTNRYIFNASLAATDAPDAPHVPVVVADLAEVSEWFLGVVRQRDEMSGGPLEGVVVPFSVPHELLQAVVDAMYTGSLTIDADTLEPLLKLADAMLFPDLAKTCSSWAVQTLQDPDCTPEWLLQLHNLFQQVRTRLRDAEAALLFTLVSSSMPSMRDDMLPILACVIQSAMGKAAQAGSSATQTAGNTCANVVNELRACLHKIYGPNCPEVFLLLLLLALGRHGLKLGQLVPHVVPRGLHQLDVAAVVAAGWGPLQDDVAGDLAVHRLLLPLAVQSDTSSDCKHLMARVPPLVALDPRAASSAPPKTIQFKGRDVVISSATDATLSSMAKSYQANAKAHVFSILPPGCLAVHSSSVRVESWGPPCPSVRVVGAADVLPNSSAVLGAFFQR